MKPLKHPHVHLTQTQVNKNLIVNHDDFDMVKYYLTSPELSVHADIHADNEKVLREAFRREDWKMVEFLLTSPKLKEKANLNYGKGALFRSLLNRPATAENLQKIEFFFTSPRLTEHFNLKADGLRLIEAIADENRQDVLYLLMEKQIYCADSESTQVLVNNFIQKNNFEAIKNLWEHPVTKEYCHYRNTDLFKQKYLSLSKQMTYELSYYIFQNDEEYLPNLRHFYQLSKNHYGQKCLKSIELYNRLNDKFGPDDSNDNESIVQKI